MENSEKTYTIFVEPTANEKMQEHYEFLARVSEPAAARLWGKLEEAMRALAYMPQRHPPLQRDYLPPGNYHSVVCEKRYRVVYIIIDNAVYVEDIEDTRQGEDKGALYPL